MLPALSSKWNDLVPAGSWRRAESSPGSTCVCARLQKERSAVVLDANVLRARAEQRSALRAASLPSPCVLTLTGKASNWGKCHQQETSRGRPPLRALHIRSEKPNKVASTPRQSKEGNEWSPSLLASEVWEKARGAPWLDPGSIWLTGSVRSRASPFWRD